MYPERKLPQVRAIIGLLAVVVCAASARAPEAIIRQDYETPDENGAYRWALQTEGGIYHEQRGRLESAGAEEPSLVVEGQYQYTAPDGQVINVQYTADANGFHPSGAHLPTPPPVPPAIQRALDYLKTLPPSTPAPGSTDY